jgi:hypothetical protein
MQNRNEGKFAMKRGAFQTEVFSKFLAAVFPEISTDELLSNAEGQVGK